MIRALALLIGCAAVLVPTTAGRAESNPKTGVTAARESPARRWVGPGERRGINYTNDDWWTLRLDYAPPFERRPGQQRVADPVETVRHSWDQDRDGSWDFSIGVLGRHPLHTLLDVPGFVDVGGNEVLGSVFARRWDAATFVAAERRDRGDRERIYDWSAHHYRDAYVSGRDPSRRSPLAYGSIPPGLRGEHRGRRDLPVRLYLSPVDRKLHLLDADGGLWNVDDGVQVRYSSLGGHYINRWEVTHDGRTTKLLYFVSDQLVSAEADGVVVAPTAVPPAVFVVPPPRDEREWERLRRKLALFRPSRPPDDLRHAVHRFGRPVWMLPGAELHGFRLQGNGFRFVLRLKNIADGVPWLAGLSPGSYVVTYSRTQGYRAQPWTPADLALDAPEPDSPTEVGTVFVNVPVVNRGLDDASAAVVTVHASAPREAPRPIGAVTLDVPAGERRVARVAWVPGRSGPWTLQATVGDRESANTSIEVTPVPRQDLSQLLPLTWSTLALLVLAVAAATGAIVSCRASAIRSVGAAASGTVARRAQRTILLCVATLAVVAPSYYVLRSGGQWAEHDTGAFAVSIRAVLDEATYRPAAGYQHGYVYPALSAFLVHLTGLNPVSLLGIAAPFLSVALVPVLYALFRELTASSVAGALALLLVYLQPEYLFAVLRGTHEKFTLTLIATAMLLAVKAFLLPRVDRRRRIFLVLAGLAVATALVTNALFAFAFIAAAVLVFTGLQALFRDRSPFRVSLVRLAIAGAIPAAFVVVVVLVYPPAMLDLGVARDAVRKLGALASRSTPLVNPYAYVQIGWTGPGTYLAVSLANWLILGASFTVWLLRGWQWLVRGARPEALSHILLWLLYGAYMTLLVAVTVIDITGFLASNMQHRIFPYLVLVAAPLTAWGLMEGLRRTPARLLLVTLVTVSAWCAVASVLKAGNEPLVSNQWPFYTDEEAAALRWTDQVSRHALVWTGPTARLHSVLRILGPSRANANLYDVYTPGPATRRFVVSDVIRAQMVRLGTPLPELRRENRIYDNGETQVFHLRSRTPYQR